MSTHSGYTEFQVYFSVTEGKKTKGLHLYDILRSSAKVIWVGEVGGDYQHGMTLCARDFRDVGTYLENLAGKLDLSFQKKSISTVVSFTQFQKKYLFAGIKEPGAISISYTETRDDIDQTDIAILQALYDTGCGTQLDVARALKLPRSTVQYRLEKLEEQQVIEGYVYFTSAAALGMQTYKFLVYLRGFLPGVRDRLYEFCLKHKNVVNLIECLGNWDFEIGVEVERQQDTTEVARELYAEFSELIQDIQILPVFRQASASKFLQEKSG